MLNMNDYIIINIVAVSKKDDKKRGYGWVKFVPSDDKPFWAEKVPGAKFDLATLGKDIDTNGIYRVRVNTSNPFGMPSFEILNAEYLGKASDLVREQDPF